MHFISLVKWKKFPTKELMADPEMAEMFKQLEKKGIKMRGFWTLGRYDAVYIIEAPNEKDAMKLIIKFQDIMESETLTAIPREEVINLL
jgi:uncharacterized protein with GYD domain